MKNFLIAFGLLTTALNAQGPANNTANGGVTVAVIVNKAVITHKDIDERARLELVLRGQEISPQSVSEMHKQSKDALIDDQLKLQGAKAKQITMEPKELQKAIEDLAAQNHLTQDKLVAMLKSKGVSKECLESTIKAQMIWAKFIRSMYEPLVHVADTELDAMESEMEQKKADHKADPNDMAVTLHQAFYPLKPDSSEEEMMKYGPKVEEAMKLKSSQAFITTAKSHGATIKDVTVRLKDIPGEMRTPIKNCKSGECLPPVMTPQGLLVINVGGKQMPKYETPKRDELRGMIEQDKFGRYAARELEKLKRVAYIDHK
jgi:peptidyl-prolyl cis-trans isomerase SurA